MLQVSSRSNSSMTQSHNYKITTQNVYLNTSASILNQHKTCAKNVQTTFMFPAIPT